MHLYFTIISLFVVALVDTYFYYSLRQVIKGRKREKTVPNWFRYSYWAFTGFTIIFFFIAMYYYLAKINPPTFARTYITGFIFIVVISKLFGIIFFMADDFKNLVLYFKEKLFPKVEIDNNNSSKIGRGTFLKRSGILVSALPFTTMMYGVVKSAFDYNVIRVKIKSAKIPAAFNGFKMVQISDIHTGSFIMKSPLEDAVKLINQQDADVVFFTGDLVNEVAEEALPFVDVFKKIKSKHGVYSVLGNHDYGDYFYAKDNLDGKKHNYALIQDVHRSMNWNLLRNENRSLEIDGSKIGLIGVENWGSSRRFQKYGDLNIAKKGMEKTDFNILLSHDPSHWNSLVRYENPEIDLTLSGHTHGFQMGIEIPGYIKWSPSKYLYEQWAGLYQEKEQMIYVNRGLGFLGYPGRLGILPEITVIELESALV